MSAVAEVMLDKGYEISGSDLSESAVVKHLQAKGATIYKGHNALNVEGKEALVLSSAIHQDNPELVAAKAKGLKLFHRSDILAYLLNDAKGNCSSRCSWKDNYIFYDQCSFRTCKS